ncbi:MAG: 16S rRNA (uracil(1498)-N(3))-methyltransferase [Desulfobacterota bacterium]|nr:16S rRNA (uracil(1498)-N(3))-methyltransferase [Thermodesulfobacteriota bacterium]
MRRFFIDKRNINGTKAIIEGKEARHAVRVLRLGQGNTIMLFDEDGSVYEGIITDIGKNTVAVDLVTTTYRHDIIQPDIILAAAVLKSDKMDLVVQKCTELGVTKIIPFFSSRTVPQWGSEAAQKKRSHWNNIAVAAVKQSGARTVPLVDMPIPFDAMLQKMSTTDAARFIMWENEKDVTLKHVLHNTARERSIAVVVGPEGGFTEWEISAARQCGFITTGFGPHVLRAETAAIAVLAIIYYVRVL